jgi:predicted transposase YbfD/YdcC
VSYDGEHGRIETGTLRATADIAWLQERHTWSSLQSIIAVTAKKAIGAKVTEEIRYFISSLDANDPQRLERMMRAHWAIENNLHWVLDIAFDEDSNRTRKGHSANLAVIRPIALNLIKAEKTSKVGIKIKPGSRYFCESFYGHPCPTSGKNYATANAFGGPSRPAPLVAYPTRGM